MSEQAPTENPAEAIAIIGMAGRFPGAADVEAFWRNLRQGVESRTTFTDEQMEAAGVDRSLYSRPDYVRSGFLLEGTELFDAAFFGYSPREAEVMDPQQRLFLECAWQALEHSGYDPAAVSGPIALFGGTGPSGYLLTRLLPNAQVMESVGPYALTLANDKDFLCTRVAHKLDLRGPAVTVQTACSTGLVTVHMACQSLLSRESDMALAGAVSFAPDQTTGELYAPGGIHSPDGHCRAFDEKAQGTAGGGGVGVVVLKRLSDALEDGDFIHAVVLSTAINNDGSAKVGFTAPGVEGQAAVITEALAVAGADPESIQFIETHGTGTTLGDPIEVAALNQAFHSRAGQRRTCALGAVKTNIGHTDTAAGLAGLMKLTLSLRHREMPPTLHFTRPNPRIDFDGGPFYVNDVLKPWPEPTTGTPRRGGVSSFGMGGTNAHAVLEEAPARQHTPSAKPRHLLALSARTPEALEQATDNLAAWLASHPEADLGDVAYTLLAGRRRFEHRRVLVCGGPAEAQRLLQSREPGRVLTTQQEAKERPVVFLFPGQGTQEPGMAREAYESEPVFRRHLDECCKKLVPHLGFDLREVLYPKPGQEEQAAERLKQTALAQPALFVVEYALARLWMSWGVKPQAMVGHSLGEYVAACLAGVFPVDDALALVAERGRLMQQQPGGAMLSVNLSEQALRPLLGPELELASVNAPSLCVAAGPTSAVEALEARLTQQGAQHRRLHTSHAFHSAMMEAALAPFEARVRALRLSPPKTPFISNVTGTWITPEQATNPRYWADHLRRPVRFAEGVATLLSEPARLFLEVGPGRALSTLVRQCAGNGAAVTVVGSLGARREQPGTGSPLLEAAGQLWLEGVKLEAAKLYASEKRGRLPLPTYPFQRERYWLERGAGLAHVQQVPATTGTKAGVGDWFHVPAWKPVRLPATGLKELSGTSWLVYVDGTGVGRQVVEELEAAGARVVRVVPRAEGLARLGELEWGLAPGRQADHDALWEELARQGPLPAHVLHLWSLEPASSLEEEQARGFQDLLALGQALGPRLGQTESTLHVVTCGTQDVTGDEPLRPGNALVLGPCRVLPQEESPRLRCRLVDVVLPTVGARLTRLAKQVVAELRAPAHEPLVALRGEHRWVEGYAPHPLPASGEGLGRLREGGTYLVTGGLGRIGLAMAEELASVARARLVLVGRSPFPERSEWPAWLAARGEQDAVSRKIRRLQAMESKGAQVLLVRADVSQPAQLERALTLAREHFGALHGVVHSAGQVGEDTHVSARESTPERCEPLVRAKVQGTLALAEALREQPLDFVLLQSSVSTVLGGLGFSAYAAGNAFLDCLAAARSRQGATPWVAVDWDGWQARDEDEAGTSITLPEGMDALRRLLAVPEVSRWIVSTHELTARRTRWVQQVQQAARAPTTRHRRPTLRTAYEAPRDSLERGLADIWQELLGVAEVGIHDDFFELGGHSLLGSQVLSRVRESFQVELPLRTLFEHPTLAGMATVILQKRAASTDSAALEALLSELE